MKNKRFQECNWLVKLYRYRYYLYLPFRFIYWGYIFNPTLKFGEELTRKQFFGILIGEAKLDMNWTYTQEEITLEGIRREYKKDDKTISF